jgi:hypothetical protein
MKICILVPGLLAATRSNALAIGPTVTVGLHGDFGGSNFSGLGANGVTSQMGNVYGVGWGEREYPQDPPRIDEDLSVCDQ